MPSAVQDKEDKRFEQRLTPTQLTMVSAVYDHPNISPIENISIEYYPNPADTGRTIVGGGWVEDVGACFDSFVQIVL